MTVVFCSCSNQSTESNPQNNTNQQDATVTENSGCFKQRLSEFNSAYPDKKNGFESLSYANSKYSLTEFKQRLSEFNSAYPDKKDEHESLQYANSKHSLSEFKQRLINTPLTKVECFAMLTGEVKKEELNQFVETISNLWQ